MKGMSRLGLLIFILIMMAGIYSGFQIVPFYVDYWELQGLIAAQANKASEFSDDEIRRNLVEKIQKLEIPFDSPDEIKINRFNGKISINFEYDEVFYIDLGEDRTYDIYVFHFDPSIELALRGK